MDYKYTEKQIWDKVLLARHPDRPTAQSLIKYLVSDFVELHGDRLFRDDQSIIGGVGCLNKIPVTIVAHEKGVALENKIKHNFGMAHPEGYRKAARLMQQAEKFNRPVIQIIDTPGAYPGVGAEERGQAFAIAENLAMMSKLKTPLISIVLGEGGSGGALAIGVSDEIWMMENSIYSILSPEGFASILYKDVSLAKKAAATMRLTAEDLFEFKICDHIIPEPEEGLQSNPEYSFKILKEELTRKIIELKSESIEELLKRRYQKYRHLGLYKQII